MTAPSRDDAGRAVTVLVADDHDVVHWGLRMLLGEQPWVGRVLAAKNAAEAVAAARAEQPEVALVDLFLGGDSGAECCEAIRVASPATRVLLVSGAGRISAQAARAAGASGFVAKDWEGRDLAQAVRMVALGMTVFDDAAAEPAVPTIALTPRESEVLRRIAGGATNREIAAALFLSPHTIKEHTSALYRKLGARNRTDAVQRGQRLGLLG